MQCPRSKRVGQAQASYTFTPPSVVYSIPVEKRNKDVWIVVGGGPSRENWLSLAWEFQASIVATNAACLFIANPNVFLASDADAMTRFFEAQHSLRVHGCDIRFGEHDVGRSGARLFQRIRSIGIHGIRHAMANGAKKIILCGLDGWNEDEMSYATLSNKTSTRFGMNENMAQNIQAIKQAHPKIEIVFSAPSILSELVERGNVISCEFITQKPMCVIDNGNPMIDGSCVTNIEGKPRHHFRDATIMVIGKAPSAELDINRHGIIKIGVNSTPAQTDYDIVCASDSAWWVDNYQNITATSGRPIIIPKHAGNVSMPLADNIHRASMTNVKVNNTIYTQCTANVNGAHKSVHRGAIMAVMCALYLTRGKVIVTGCDLEGCDVAGNNYQQYQTERWRRACPSWTRVFASKHLTGPIVDENMLPREEG